MGLDPACDKAPDAIALGTTPRGIPRPVTATRPCSRARSSRASTAAWLTRRAYFGVDVTRIVGSAAGRADGRWRLELRAGERLDPWRPPVDHERAGRPGRVCERVTGGSPQLATARHRGEEVPPRAAPHAPAVDRRADRQRGDPPDPVLDPSQFHYDVLRALDYFRDAGRQPDERIREAIGVVEGKRDTDGRWALARPLPRPPAPLPHGRRAKASPATGTPCVPCACCAGPRDSPSASSTGTVCRWIDPPKPPSPSHRRAAAVSASVWHSLSPPPGWAGHRRVPSPCSCTWTDPGSRWRRSA